jgi:hypothetical protein
MTENKGIALEEMFREFIIPYIKTKLNTKDEKVNWLKLFLIISLAGIATLSLMSLYQLYVLTITQ